MVRTPTGKEVLQVHFMRFHQRYDVWVERSRVGVRRRGEGKVLMAARKQANAEAKAAKGCDFNRRILISY